MASASSNGAHARSARWSSGAAHFSVSSGIIAGRPTARARAPSASSGRVPEAAAVRVGLGGQARGHRCEDVGAVGEPAAVRHSARRRRQLLWRVGPEHLSEPKRLLLQVNRERDVRHVELGQQSEHRRRERAARLELTIALSRTPPLTTMTAGRGRRGSGRQLCFSRSSVQGRGRRGWNTAAAAAAAPPPPPRRRRRRRRRRTAGRRPNRGASRAAAGALHRPLPQRPRPAAALRLPLGAIRERHGRAARTAAARSPWSLGAPSARPCCRRAPR